MTTYEIILTVVLVVWLAHYIWWGIRASKAVKNHKRVLMKLHPEGIGADPDWPPSGLDFP